MTPPATAATHDWRPIAEAPRRASSRSLLALWVAGIEARLVYLQVVQHADLVARAERQQERTQPSPAKRGDIFDRHGRVLATSVDADTSTPCPTEIDDAARRRDEALRRARRLRRARIAQALAERLGAAARVRLRAAPGRARSGASASRR